MRRSGRVLASATGGYLVCGRRVLGRSFQSNHEHHLPVPCKNLVSPSAEDVQVDSVKNRAGF